MMKKNLILLIVLAILCTVFFWDRKHTEQEKEREEKEKQIVSISKDEIKEVTIVKENETFKATKDGERWILSQPFAADGDKSAWDGIVSSYTTGKLQRVVEENASDLQPFGLKTPKISVSLAGIGGATMTTIHFGDQTPTSGKYFASIQGSSEVLTLWSSLYNLVDKKMYDLRDKTIVEMETNQVQKVEIAHDNVTMTLERQGDDQWVITNPVQARADETKINEFLNGVKSGQIREFIEETPESVEAYGLVNPATKLVFWTGEKNNQSSWAARAILIGTSSAAENLYAKREGQKNVFSVSPNDFKKVPVDVDSLRLRNVSSLRNWEISRLILSSSSALILDATKSGGDWLLLQPEAGKTNYTTFSNLVRDVAELKIATFVQGTTEEYGLGTPDIVIDIAKDQSPTDTGTPDKKPSREAISLTKGKDVNARYYFGVRTDPVEIFGIRIEDVDALMLKAQGIKVEPPPSTAATDPSSTQPIDAIQPPDSIQPIDAIQPPDSTQPQQ